MERGAKCDRNFSIVLAATLGLATFNIRHQPAKARMAYEKAFEPIRGRAPCSIERDQLVENGSAKNAETLW